MDPPVSHACATQVAACHAIPLLPTVQTAIPSGFEGVQPHPRAFTLWRSHSCSIRTPRWSAPLSPPHCAPHRHRNLLLVSHLGECRADWMLPASPNHPLAICVGTHLEEPPYHRVSKSLPPPKELTGEPAMSYAIWHLLWSISVLSPHCALCPAWETREVVTSLELRSPPPLRPPPRWAKPLSTPRCCSFFGFSYAWAHSSFPPRCRTPSAIEALSSPENATAAPVSGPRLVPSLHGERPSCPTCLTSSLHHRDGCPTHVRRPKHAECWVPSGCTLEHAASVPLGRPSYA
jgi:hypothetical protein